MNHNRVVHNRDQLEILQNFLIEHTPNSKQLAWNKKTDFLDTCMWIATCLKSVALF